MPSALQTLTFTVIGRSCKTNSMWEAQIFGSVNIRIWEKGACGILIFHTQSGHCVDNSGCIDGIVIHDLAVSNEGTQRRLMSKEHLVVPSLLALFLFGESLIWAFRPPHSHSSFTLFSDVPLCNAASLGPLQTNSSTLHIPSREWSSPAVDCTTEGHEDRDLFIQPFHLFLYLRLSSIPIIPPHPHIPWFLQ